MFIIMRKQHFLQKKLLLLCAFAFVLSTPCLQASLALKAPKRLSLFQPDNPTPLPNLYLSGYTSINQSSQTVLANYNGDKPLPPASLTKLMTLYIAYDYIKQGLLQLDEKVTISKKAWKTEGSRMFLEPETHVPVEQLLQGISVVSGNDASVAIAEHIAGSEQKFVKLMNEKVTALKLANTHFANATGLPDKAHYSTPYDMSLIGINLVNDHPEVLEHTKMKTMTYGNITQNNRNRLLWSDDHVYGLKTGHTQEAGYCLVAAAKRNGQTIIATAFGARTEKARDSAVKKLLNHAESQFRNVSVTHDKNIPKARTWYGKTAYVTPSLQSTLHLSVPHNDVQKLSMKVSLDESIQAPLKKGDSIGSYRVYLDGTLIREIPLISSTDVPVCSILGRLIDWISLKLTNAYQFFTAR